MVEISATHLARNMSEVLDGVEHRGESYVVVRHGRPVARLEAAPSPTGRELREYFENLEPDPEFADAVEEIHNWANSLPARLHDPWRD